VDRSEPEAAKSLYERVEKVNLMFICFWPASGLRFISANGKNVSGFRFRRWAVLFRWALSKKHRGGVFFLLGFWGGFFFVFSFCFCFCLCVLVCACVLCLVLGCLACVSRGLVWASGAFP
jgi:hypothetical protein